MSNLALVDDRDPACHRECFVLIMRDCHKSDADLFLQFGQFELHLRTQLGIERRQRLVKQQHLGPHYKASRERNALPLPA